MEGTNIFVDDVVSGIIEKVDNIFIEGLKRKGHVFNSRFELENFIKERCNCIEKDGVKTYSCDHIPFLVYEPENDFGIEQDFITQTITFKGSIGTYSFQ